MSASYVILEADEAIDNVINDVTVSNFYSIQYRSSISYNKATDVKSSMTSSSLPYIIKDLTAAETSDLEQATKQPLNNEEMDVANLLWMFMGPVIFFVGLCGNALILLVMTRPRMRGTSTCVYLTMMAVADSMVLITGMIPEWLEACKILMIKEIHPVSCKLEKFFFYTSGDTAVWILVIFTVDRFIAVCFPLQKSKFCLSSRARIYSLAALLGSATKNIHVFWTRGYELYYKNSTGIPILKETNCGRPTEEFKYFEQYVRPWIAFTLINGLPFVIILLCNVFIVRALIRVRRMRFEHSIVSTSDKSLIQMTCMCLSASFCFLIFVTPSIILLIGKPAWHTGSSEDAYNLAKAINNLLFYVNHSVNFFLYCLTGRRFRQVIAAFCRKKKRKRGSDSFMSDSESKTTIYRTSSPERTRRHTTAVARYSFGGPEGMGKHLIEGTRDKRSHSSGNVNGGKRTVVLVGNKNKGRFLRAPESRL